MLQSVDLISWINPPFGGIFHRYKLYYNKFMDRSENRDRKVMWRIGGIMLMLIVILVAVIIWQLNMRRSKEEVSSQQVVSAPMMTSQIPPELTDYPTKLRLSVGTAYDLLTGVKANIETEDAVALTVEGDFDFNTAGNYDLQFVARSKSGEEALEDFVLEVVAGEPGLVEILERRFKTEKGFWAKTENGLTEVDGVLIANKSFGLPAEYGDGLVDEVNGALANLEAEARTAGLEIWVVSGFRSYETQRQLYNRYVARDGQTEADTYSARPGFSEHQTGLAVDLNLADSRFADTPEGQWLADNVYKYGFILRYPNGKSEITGYTFEPWHFRFVGTDLATKLYNNGDWISLEEYFGLPSAYKD